MCKSFHFHIRRTDISGEYGKWTRSEAEDLVRVLNGKIARQCAEEGRLCTICYQSRKAD